MYPLQTLYPDIQINSYCNFTPGGNHNTITGKLNLDINNNGCDANDAVFPNIKVGINDGLVSGASFTNNKGNYTFFTGAGTFAVAPQFQNSYFTIEPATSTIVFTNANNNSQVQDFCVLPNGIHKDLDITILPIHDARLGFDANYQLVYKNKGNQTLTGGITLNYNDAVLDFVAANPSVASLVLNNLNWNYSNLLPFESRTIDFTLNVNTPTETPAVNINDVLNFTATINPISGDETISDNTLTLSQTVVGSFDPNDKVCVEGKTIPLAKVGDYLHNVIRFQNSETAPAENIVIEDVIDSTKFNMATFQLTSSSHPNVTRLTGNKAEFIFKVINLPPQSINELASNGFVAFKIKTKSNLF